MVLLHGNDSEFLVFLGKNGETKKIVPLLGSAKKQFLDIRTFNYKGKDYILVNGFDDTIIYDFDRQLIAALKTPLITGGAAASEIDGSKGKKYLALYVEHKLPTRSATIFILSEKMEIVYQEIVTGRRGLWIGKQADADGKHLIIVTYEDLITKDGSPRNVIWRYSIEK